MNTHLVNPNNLGFKSFDGDLGWLREPQAAQTLAEALEATTELAAINGGLSCLQGH
jgi:hypothetical protein